MTAVTHRLIEKRNPTLLDFLEMFQNIIHIEHNTPSTQQVQDHLTVDLSMRMLEHGIEHEIYCTMHGHSWGLYEDPIFHNPELQSQAGVNRPYYASISSRPPPTPWIWVSPGHRTHMTAFLNQSAATQR